MLARSAVLSMSPSLSILMITNALSGEIWIRWPKWGWMHCCVRTPLERWPTQYLASSVRLTSGGSWMASAISVEFSLNKVQALSGGTFAPAAKSFMS